MTYVLVKQANIASDDGLQTSVIFFIKTQRFSFKKINFKILSANVDLLFRPQPFSGWNRNIPG